MRKHQFAKADCACGKRASYFVCRFCGAVEYASPAELRELDTLRATCTAPDAPFAPPAEKMAAAMGGFFDCLATEEGKEGKC